MYRHANNIQQAHTVISLGVRAVALWNNSIFFLIFLSIYLPIILYYYYFRTNRIEWWVDWGGRGGAVGNGFRIRITVCVYLLDWLFLVLPPGRPPTENFDLRRRLRNSNYSPVVFDLTTTTRNRCKYKKNRLWYSNWLIKHINNILTRRSSSNIR